MSKLPVISGRQAVKVFEKVGWNIERRAKSRHIIMKKEGMLTILSIPEHKTLDRGLLRALIRDAYMSIMNLIKYLKVNSRRAVEMLELEYSLIIESTEEPDYFGFYSPDLEGFTGIGHSVEDCIYKAKWGMKEHINLLKKQGIPIPDRNMNPKIIIQDEERLLVKT
jgi:predicted RNA binding protein YcfA (HicA-like mRNA interferase family)/predicted RNase H-like HicB family nuclease